MEHVEKVRQSGGRTLTQHQREQSRSISISYQQKKVKISYSLSITEKSPVYHSGLNIVFEWTTRWMPRVMLFYCYQINIKVALGMGCNTGKNINSHVDMAPLSPQTCLRFRIHVMNTSYRDNFVNRLWETDRQAHTSYSWVLLFVFFVLVFSSEDSYFLMYPPFLSLKLSFIETEQTTISL